MKTITATVPAWLASNQSLATIKGGDPDRAVSDLTFWASHNKDGSGPESWVKVGTAEITVTFDDVEQITSKQIAVLRSAQQKVKADCELALTQLEGQIQNLLCIESK